MNPRSVNALVAIALCSCSHPGAHSTAGDHTEAPSELAAEQALIWELEAEGFQFAKTMFHVSCETTQDCYPGLACIESIFMNGWRERSCEIDCARLKCPAGFYCVSLDHGPVVPFCSQ